MKGSILLIADGDPKSDDLISSVAKKERCELRRANTSADVFRALGKGLSDVDVVIIDLDSGIQALLILEILTRSEVAPPVIAITGLFHPEIGPLACQNGAAICLPKPLEATSLTDAIERELPQRNPGLRTFPRHSARAPAPARPGRKRGSRSNRPI